MFTFIGNLQLDYLSTDGRNITIPLEYTLYLKYTYVQ